LYKTICRLEDIIFSLFEPGEPTETDRRPPLGCYR
jgi:hypothetical protein